jgi:cyclase
MRNIFALLVLLSGLPLAAQNGPPLQTQQVSEKIYMISGRGGNIGVSVGADGLLMVDDKFADLADDIRAEL